MRCTVGSIAALAAGLILAFSMWPDNPAPKLISHATADGTDKPPTEKSVAGKPEAIQKDLDKLVKAAQNLPDSLTAEKESELNDQFGEFDFQGIPLNDVLGYIYQSHHTAEWCFDNGALKDAGVDPTTTLVTISYKHIRLKTCLEMILSPFNLGYHFHDGIMIITSKQVLEATLENRVYDCRDILSADDDRFRMYPNQISAGKDDGKLHTPVDDLINVITRAVAPQTWIEKNGPQRICEYNGLLVVSATSAVQSQVADLLEKLSNRLALQATK